MMASQGRNWRENSGAAEADLLGCWHVDACPSTRFPPSLLPSLSFILLLFSMCCLVGRFPSLRYPQPASLYLPTYLPTLGSCRQAKSWLTGCRAPSHISGGAVAPELGETALSILFVGSPALAAKFRSSQPSRTDLAIPTQLMAHQFPRNEGGRWDGEGQGKKGDGAVFGSWHARPHLSRLLRPSRGGTDAGAE